MIKLNIVRLGLCAVMASALASSASAEIVVIVASNSPLGAITTAQVADIFLSKSGTTPDGRTAVPIDQADGSAIRQEFYLKATGKSRQLLRAYWSTLIFTGRAEPPREVSDSARIKKLVAGNPGFIGYIDRSELDASVKPILALP